MCSRHDGFEPTDPPRHFDHELVSDIDGLCRSWVIDIFGNDTEVASESVV